MVQEKVFGWFCKFTSTEIIANLAGSFCIQSYIAKV
jgi:hypothetical protein